MGGWWDNALDLTYLGSQYFSLYEKGLRTIYPWIMLIVTVCNGFAEARPHVAMLNVL
jgi:hypothetical protein